jgi:hypothetical protein
MAILDEMQLLVSDLEAAFSRRAEAELERQETAAIDARDRAMAFRELLVASAEDSRERLAEISRRNGEVADMLDSFCRDRTTMAASAERHRLAQERARRAEAVRDARARTAEFRELSAIWADHVAVMGGAAVPAPRRAMGKAAKRPPQRAASGPAAAKTPARPARGKSAAARPAASEADRPDRTEDGTAE